MLSVAKMANASAAATWGLISCFVLFFFILLSVFCDNFLFPAKRTRALSKTSLQKAHPRIQTHSNTHTDKSVGSPSASGSALTSQSSSTMPVTSDSRLAQRPTNLHASLNFLIRDNGVTVVRPQWGRRPLCLRPITLWLSSDPLKSSQ